MDCFLIYPLVQCTFGTNIFCVFYYKSTYITTSFFFIIVSASCDAVAGSACYVLVRESLIVTDARSRCQQYGGHLAVIDNAEENTLIQQIAEG